MSTVFELEKEILALSAAEREQLAALAWDSVVGDPSAAGDPGIDPEGIEISLQRDAGIKSGAVQPIGHAEFLRRTGGDNPCITWRCSGQPVKPLGSPMHLWPAPLSLCVEAVEKPLYRDENRH